MALLVPALAGCAVPMRTHPYALVVEPVSEAPFQVSFNESEFRSTERMVILWNALQNASASRSRVTESVPEGTLGVLDDIDRKLEAKYGRSAVGHRFVAYEDGIYGVSGLV